MKFKYIASGVMLSLMLASSCKGGKEEAKPMKMNDPHNINEIGNYKKIFNDLNEKQVETAKKIGIIPFRTREDVDTTNRGLIELQSNKYFQVDSLTHSIPYLIPSAYNLLELIGVSFEDSLKSKGLNPYKIIVTSVLRTYTDINRLRRSNSNASRNSAHSYGTTFDITYLRFDKVEDPDGYPLQNVNNDTLKLVLGEVMRDLREEGKCYVKYEINQGCFHVTVR